MNAERLLAHYEQIADAPDAIARLRGFILDLAVRGKLVLQDPNDEPASELLKRIEKERTGPQAEKAKRRNRQTDKFHLRADTPLPVGWVWTTIDEVSLSMRYGTSTKCEYAATGIPVLRIPNVSNGVVSLDDIKFGPLNETEIRDLALHSGDLLMIRSNGSLDIVGRSAVVTAEAAGMAFAGYLVRLRLSLANIRPKYIWLAMKSTDVRNQIERPIRSAVGLKNVNLTEFGALTVPLPPLAEQTRIVAKIDELMVLCDRLEAARAGREAARDRLAAASLGRLNAPDPETFQDDARFLLDALPTITTRPDQIKALRQTILNLAVRGKLVPQDANDESATELLRRIAKERTELVKRREIRREDPLDPILRAEVPFDVPASWVWSRIGEAVLFTQYGTSQKSTPSEKGVPVLTMGNIQDGLVICSNDKRIPESSEDLPALYLRRFDLLYNRTNSAELVGKTGIYLGEDGVRTFASYLIRLRPSLLSSNPHFLNMAMNTPEFRETQIVPLIKKQTGQANVNGTALKNMLIPLPPLAEQHRIVAKVNALMALCDRLEGSLDQTAATRRLLLDALLAEALAPVDAREMEAAE